MQKPSREEQKHDINSFHVIDEAPDVVLDRSLLEAWSVCPFQAHALESKLVTVVGELAVIGECAHQAFSAATRAWIDSGMQLSPRDLAAEIENAALASRPDVQPDVLQATRWMAREWADYLGGWNAANIACFDGGEDCDRSGQLSMSLAGVVVTSELDFLGTLRNEGYECDFKTGWKEHTEDSIKASFQFQMHAALVFANYEDLHTLYVRCWNTRRNTKSPWVAFSRRNELQYKSRVAEAVAVRMRGELETWPTLEKCAICPAASLCPASDEVTKVDPQDNLRQLVAAQAKVDALTARLKLCVDHTGRDVRVGKDAFGRQKPAAEKKKPVALYTLKEKADA